MAEAENKTTAARFLTLLDALKAPHAKLKLSPELVKAFGSVYIDPALAADVAKFPGAELAKIIASINPAAINPLFEFYTRLAKHPKCFESPLEKLVKIGAANHSKPPTQAATNPGDRRLVAAIKDRLEKGERPGSTVTWSKFCHDIRTDCDAFKGNPKHDEFKRGFSDDTIKRTTRKLMKPSLHQG